MIVLHIVDDLDAPALCGEPPRKWSRRRADGTPIGQTPGAVRCPVCWIIRDVQTTAAAHTRQDAEVLR